MDDEKVPLRECSAQMLLGSSALHLRATGRYFRARLNADKQASLLAENEFLIVSASVAVVLVAKFINTIESCKLHL